MCPWHRRTPCDLNAGVRDRQQRINALACLPQQGVLRHSARADPGDAVPYGLAAVKVSTRPGAV
jgi:hypothetical protein